MNEEKFELDLLTGTVVKSTEDYEIVKLDEPDQDGNLFEKRMKYKRIATHMPESENEIVELYAVLNDSTGEKVTPMKEVIGLTFVAKNFYTSPYDSFDGKTGQTSRGVTTTIEDTDGNFYATSSKSVYYSVLNLYENFGMKPFILQIVGIKREKGRVQINVQLTGIFKPSKPVE